MSSQEERSNIDAHKKLSDTSNLSASNPSDGGCSSFSRLLNSSHSADKSSFGNSKLKRRSSLFEDISRSRAGGVEEGQSAFYLASLTQESSTSGEWQPRHQGFINDKRQRRSSTNVLASSSSSSSGASRSLFPPSNAPTNMTVSETQNLSAGLNFTNTSTNSTVNSVTPKASGRSQHFASASNNKSLFGSVMQQLQQHDKSSTPSKWKDQTPKKHSAFTPTRHSSSMPFGSPGGFQLLDFVNGVASPFSKQSNHSNMSTKSALPDEWQNTLVEQGIMDRSLPKSLRFDCHPGTVIDSLLTASKTPGGSGLLRFLRPDASTTKMASNTDSELGLAQWGSGLLLWQHPAVYPSPFLDHTSMSSLSSEVAKAAKRKEDDPSKPRKDPFSKLQKKRRTSDLSQARPLSEGASALPGHQQRRSSLQKQQKKFSRQRQREWQQAFQSLYWKWISQLQEQRHNQSSQQLPKKYFYALGNDHTVLFLADLEDDVVIPKIIMTSSSEPFRNKLQRSGVRTLRLLKSWKGYVKGTEFREVMLQQKLAKKPQHKPEPTQSADTSRLIDRTKLSATPPAGKENNAASAPSATPSKQGAVRKLLSPRGDSSSPKLEAELTALRRAQVFGETVGADVSVAMKPKIAAAQKFSLKSLPPLYLTGWDDCMAFFEVYLNLMSTCSICYATGGDPSAVTKESKKLFTEKETNTPLGQQRWCQQDEVPLLVCRSVGPFLHSTMKCLTVRGQMQYCDRSRTRYKSNDYASLEVLGGPILPCAMQELFTGVVNTMRAEKDGHSAEACHMDGLLESEDEDVGADIPNNDAIVGSHNFILRATPANVEDGNEENEMAKNGIIGLAGAHFLNHGCATAVSANDAGDLPAFPCTAHEGHRLDMVVWDILHANAVAYKLEPADFTLLSSALSSL